MKIYSVWLKRKKASLCILTGICAVSLFIIFNSGEKIKENSGGSYVVKIKHYGINALEIERSITIPVEDALFSISGILSLHSSSENSQSSVFIRFRPGSNGRYEAVRDAVQKVYETFPASVQRPEIISSNNSRVPVWSAAVISDNLNEAAHILEKIIKPKLESLEGAGEVIVSGAGVKELIINFDQEKLGILKLEPMMITSYLGKNDFVFSGGTIIHANKSIIVTVDGRYSSLDKALIPIGEGRYIELSDIAVITEREREPDNYSRLNGKRTAGISIMGKDGADLRKLSSDINKELDKLSQIKSQNNLLFTVLSDHGAEENAAFKSVLNAALFGAVMVAFLSFLLSRKNNANISSFFCALTIPVICLLSAAVLSFAGFSFNRLMLAGIAAGIGTAIDAVILCSEKLRKCICYESASSALSSLKNPLIAGGATTIAALVPLFAIEDESVKFIAAAITVVTVISLLLSLSLLPPLLLWGLNEKANERLIKIPLVFKFFFKRIYYFLCRFLAASVKFCTACPGIVITFGLVISIIAFIMLFVKGTDVSNYGSGDSIYAQIEFDSGLLAEEVDTLLSVYSGQVLDIFGVKNIETRSRTGSASLHVSFNTKQTKPFIIRNMLKEIYIPGGFIFFQENTAKDNYWEIFIYGDDGNKCRKLAEDLAYLCADNSIIRDRTLNFKHGSKKLVLLPDREVLAESGIKFSSAAGKVRLGVYGPVAYKRLDSNGEKDVRVKTNGNILQQTKEGVLNVLVSSGRKEAFYPLTVDSLVSTREEAEISGIKRENRRRYASITVSTKSMDPLRAKKELEKTINKMDLPAGYSVEFDPEVIRKRKKLTGAAFSLVMAVIFCYMIIASVNESFKIPLLVLSAVPPSLALPAIVLVLTGNSFNSAVACAFIAVSGMTVNAAILCVDALKQKMQKKNRFSNIDIYCAIRSKLPALLSTTGTTAAGAIPFIFLLEETNSLIRTLSLVSAIGVTGSFFCSIIIIPSLLACAGKNKKNGVKND